MTFQQRLRTGLAVVGSLAAPVAAQMPAIQDNVAPPSHRGELPLVAASKALATEREVWIKLGDGLVVHNVARPTLTPFLPPAGTGTGAAVVIAPGGGFMMLSMSGEGWDVARWLASHGVAAFVLKYRLTPTPSTAAGTMTTLMQRLSTGRDAFQRSDWFADGARVAAEDAAAAMLAVRKGAGSYGIDAKKVGFMGFSAGALTALTLIQRSDAADMPAFVVPIYGSFDTPAQALPAVLPPMWASMAADDPLLGKTDFGLLNAWRANGGTVEFHLYDRGGHGYGFKGTPGTTTTNWTDAFLAWLKNRGWAK